MKRQMLREMIRSGRRVYGTLLTVDSPRWIEAAAAAGLDYLFIDLEHIALDRKQLAWMCRCAELQGLPPVVRIPGHDPDQASMALDAGARGILVPYVEEPRTVEVMAAAVKGRPLKGVRAAMLQAGRETVNETTRSYLDEFNRGNLLLINVESRRGVEQLDSLLACDELDGVIVGPHDLSCSYDLPEDYRNPRFVELVGSIIAAARARGKGAGIHQTWGNPHDGAVWAEAGANIIMYKADLIFFAARLADELGELREALGDGGQTSRRNVNL